MIIDTHCHYNIPPIWDAEQTSVWKKHWDRAQAAGVLASIVVGVDAATSTLAMNMAESDSRLLAAVGYHPTDGLPTNKSLLNPEFTQQELHKISLNIRALCANSAIAAIGEVGLDYYRLSEIPAEAEAEITHQQAICSLQLQLAAEFHLPLILHVRDATNSTRAYDDILQLLHTHASFDQPFILHCVSGSIPYIQQALKLGAYIGVAGNITYKSAQAIRDIVVATPADRILLETDAPFLAPQSFRGKPCEPWMITETGRYLATELQQDLAQILDNTLQIFPQLSSVASQAPSQHLQ